MAKIGQINKLMVIKEVPFGVYLDGKELGEILLPKKFVPQRVAEEDMVDVFLYYDTQDRIIATTQRPFAKLHQFAYLKVIDVNPVGAFLDWGLEKDLLCPRPEQFKPMELNKYYLVYLKQDALGRIIATSKLDYYLDKSTPEYSAHEQVNLIVAKKTELGIKVIVNEKHWGLVHASDIFQHLRIGQTIQGYVKHLREDGKLDIVIRKPCAKGRVQLAERILTELEKSNGFLPYHDKSPADEIYQFFGESKKRFKDTIGQLYKQGKIIIEPKGIRIIK
jgi:predicted RNA-binding protein (virulence factor B family)